MRADRLLSIVLLLQANHQMTAGELAARLEVSERTILRDMDALSAAGIPVIAERGTGGGWRLLDGYQTKLTGLSPPEIRSLFLARPEQLMSDLGLRQEADTAMLKLQAALPERARRDAAFARSRLHIDPRGWRDPGESIPALPLLLTALWQDRRVRFMYHRQLCDPGERTVDPLGLVAKGSTWYLVAQPEGEPRTYRVSRIADAVVLDEPASRPVEFDLPAYWERSAQEFRQQLPRYYATFRAAPGMMRWVRYRGWRVEEETPDEDRVRVRVRFDAEEEARQFALSFGAEVEVVEPLELRAAVVAAAREVVERYG
jgi:predicted DNA-binding transcriptional regulator YafY